MTVVCEDDATGIFSPPLFPLLVISAIVFIKS